MYSILSKVQTVLTLRHLKCNTSVLATRREQSLRMVMDESSSNWLINKTLGLVREICINWHVYANMDLTVFFSFPDPFKIQGLYIGLPVTVTQVLKYYSVNGNSRSIIQICNLLWTFALVLLFVFASYSHCIKSVPEWN